ncbi:MAG: hydrogenase maturation nickel metallochaperone HypA [Firmicutes bacterium]|nr:hydrogenase maturation nickel metallochaperone HypA [Bacillota bacterium]
MHEFSMVQEVMRVLKKSAAENNISRIKTVRLVVGKLAAVLPDSMQFCFEILAKEPPFVNTRLEIEEIDIRGRCRSCGKEFVIAGYRFNCACCGSPAVEVVAGNELYVDYYEGE